MTKETQTKLFNEFVTKQKNILEKKGDDYANQDRLSNFKNAGAIIKLNPDIQCLSLISTKVARLGELLNNKIAKNESVEDTLVDLGNYIFLLYCIRNDIKNNNINNKIIDTVKIINSIDKDVVFGGSFVLNLLNLINRPIKDLDLIYGKQKSRPLLWSDKIKFCTNESNHSETCTEEDGTVISRTQAEINGIKTCIFFLRNNLNFSEYNFDGVTIKIQNIDDIIRIKELYAKKNEPRCDKHKKDIEVINSKLNSKSSKTIIGLESFNDII